MVAEGDGVWVSFKRPETVASDNRPFVRYFIQDVGLADPSAPVLGTPINVPGELVDIDGTTAYTKDTLWGENIAETAIARLLLDDGLAYLQAVRRFHDQTVYGVTLDGAGHVLVSHRLAWMAGMDWEQYADEQQHLSVLAATDLAVVADVEVDSWATLMDARAGRALFQVPGGLLVFNLDDAALPYPQAYFPTRGWPREILIDDSDILFAAGRYGIYRFDLDVFNLLPPPMR
jgi:hypothetical protein